MTSKNDLETLKSKLQKFESDLKEMIDRAQEDLRLALEVQKLLMPDRLPQVKDIQCLARYISAGALSAEGFDLIPTPNGQDLWIVASWTERFGLSSLLLQALTHFHAIVGVQNSPAVTPDQLFNDLSLAISAAKRSGKYRLLVAKFNISSLTIEGTCVGVPPLLLRPVKAQEKGEDWKTICGEKNTWHFDAANSESPVLSVTAQHFLYRVEPGWRLYYLGGAWADARDSKSFLDPLNLESKEAKQEKTLIEELNYLLMRAEDHIKKTKREADILCLAFEIDANRLHVA